MPGRLQWGLFFVGLVLVGCSQNPPPIQEAKKVAPLDGPKPAVEISPAARPAVSEPAAKQILDDAIAAHTDKQPALLDKFKAAKVTREGPASIGTPVPVPQKWQLTTAWPDRFKVRAELPGPQIVNLGWTGQIGWRQGGLSDKLPMSTTEVNDFRIDVTGDWLILLFPFNDPEARVAMAPEMTVRNRPATAIRFWHPLLANAVLAFDKETKLLAQISFDGRELGRPVTKEFVIYETRTLHGVKVPTQFVLKSNGNQLADWTVAALDLIPTVDPKLFEQP